MKFNPVSSMRSFFSEVLKYEPSLVVINQTSDEQIVLAKNPIPTNEEEFKKYFSVTVDTRARLHQQHLLVGCNLLGERTFRDVKFDKMKPELLEWMKKEEIFVESDTLGIHKTITIGYLTQLHPTLTNRTTLRDLLRTALDDVVLDETLAITLDPSLKEQQQAAKTNGDMFIPEIPSFKVYKTRIHHRRDKLKVSTDIIGIKCAQEKAKLLKEFFTQLGSPAHYEKQIGVYVPTGAAHSLGSDNYAKLLSDHNAFLQSIVTIPVGDFTHETLDIPFSIEENTDIDQTTLHDIIMEQHWCYNVEKTSIHNKVLLTTTKKQLEEACKWVDTTLPNLYEENIADKLDVTTIKRALPRRLDKPNLTASSMAYADKLKQRTGGNAGATNAPLIVKPPRSSKPPPVGVSFDEKDFPTLPQKSKQPTTTQTKTEDRPDQQQKTSATQSAPPTFDYKAELQWLSEEIENNLKKQFEALFNTMEKKIDKLTQQHEQYRAEQKRQHEQDRAEQKKQHEDQELVNTTVTNQLRYLVDNMKNILKYATPNTPLLSPLLQGDGQL